MLNQTSHKGRNHTIQVFGKTYTIEWFDSREASGRTLLASIQIVGPRGLRCVLIRNEGNKSYPLRPVRIDGSTPRALEGAFFRLTPWEELEVA